MSRIGKKPIEIPAEVTVDFKDGQVLVKGPKGELKQKIRPEIKITLKEGKVLINQKSDSRIAKSLYGLTRTLIANMIKGVTQGFTKVLEIYGTGYRVSLEDKNLKLLVGFSHPVIIKPPQDIQFEVKDNNLVKILGINKQLVGQVADKIRRIKPPDVYKGKGIRYQGEQIKLKPGKAAKVGAVTEE